MKKREFENIAFEKSGADMLILNHLTGEMQVPCSGGAYVLNVGCGCGKSTAITSLVKLFPNEGFIIFENTKAECDVARGRLVAAGIMPSEIMTLHGDSADYHHLHNDPESITQCRVIIAPSIHLFSDFLPVLFAYDGGRRVDLEPYVGDVAALMKSNFVRRFVLIDEATNFTPPFATFNGIEKANIFSKYSSKRGKDGVAVDSSGGGFINPLTLEQMEQFYFSRVAKTSSKFFKDVNAHSKFKAREILAYIRQYFESVATKSGIIINHNLVDLVQYGSKCNLYLFDATGAILSNYKKSRFKLIESNCKSYSSPITFEKFVMTVDRWKSGERADAATIAGEVKVMADEVERQINSISGSLLVVTWKYMSLRFDDPEKESAEIDVISQLDCELKSRSLEGRYSIIYRGSGDDRATNKFADYQAICFLGEWKCGTASVKSTNRNMGIKSTELNHRVAGMVQAICRIRIRHHEGESIKVFYSSDVDSELMAALYIHFIDNTEPGCLIEGVPIFIPDNRTLQNIEKLRLLCDHNPVIFNSIKKAVPCVVDIPFADIKRLIPMGEKRRRAYNHLKKWLLSEYKLELNIL